MKRSYHGTFHHWSPKHMQRYVNEFTGRNNIRGQDTETKWPVSSVAWKEKGCAIRI